MLGTGHGGIEAIILGILAAVNFVFLVGYRSGYFTGLVPVEQEIQVQQLLVSVFSAPWYTVILGALERLFAMSFHLALSLMVMQVFVGGGLAWLLLAVLWHALIDAVAVVAVRLWGPTTAVGLVGVGAIISVMIVLWLKEPEPEEILEEPLPEAGPFELEELEVTPEKLKDSRYYG